MASVKLKEDIYANSAKQRSLKKMVCGWEQNLAKTIQLLENNIPRNVVQNGMKKTATVMVRKNKRKKTIKISTVPLKRLQESCGNGSENELSAEHKTFTDQIQFPESTAVDLQMNVDQTSLCQRFLQHLYE